MRKFLNRFIEDTSRTEDTIIVQHGKDTHNITFLKGSISSGAISVLDLKKAVQAATQTPDINAIKLVFAGKTLKDDNSPLQIYNLKDASKVLCMASKVKLPAGGVSNTASRSGTPTPGSDMPKKKVIPPMERINLVQTYINDTMMPLVIAFEKSPPKDREQRTMEHRRLGETVMGELLKLDSVDTDGADGTEVRARRKEAVRGMQNILERLDVALKKSEETSAIL